MESHYHYVMMGILYPMQCRFTVYHELESGYGYLDTILISNDGNNKAIILEYKYEEVEKEETLAEHAKKALQQIKDKEYYAVLMKYPHVKTVVKIGMAFFEKKVEIVHEETDLSELIKNI
eukprot:GHVL01037290.1.p1 GENE.GHVL01037290.1~~GHVL01037290.1.p1  ORF type:complete len:120 (+),score=18.58 GHVL01037290.1:212-571(+)